VKNLRERGDLGDLCSEIAADEHGDQGTSGQARASGQEEAEVVPGGGEDGVDAVAVAPLEVIDVRKRIQ